MKSYISKITTLLIATTLSACAIHGKQTPLEQPTAYPLPEGRSASFSEKGWWKKLNDPVLNGLIDTAIRNSPNLRIAHARLQQAQAQTNITTSASKTQISLSAQGTAVRTNTRPSSLYSNTNHNLILANTGLQSSWTLDFWGKNREQISSALGRQQAISYEAEHIQTNLANSIAAQYFNWQTLSAQLLLLDERIKISDDMQTLLKQRIRAGLISADALYPLEQARQKLQLARTAILQDNGKNLNALSELTGSIPGSLTGKTPSSMTTPPNIAVKGLRADLLASRPDISAQKSLLQSKLHNINATRAEFYPNIEIRALLGLGHIDAFNIVRGKNTGILGILPALHLPIFTSGALQSKLKKKQAEYNEQVAVYDQTVLNAMRTAADALNNYEHAKAALSTQENILKLAQKSADNAARRKKSGLGSGLDVLQKKDELLQEKMNQVQYQANLLTAWSNLHAQFGGGFKAP